MKKYSVFIALSLVIILSGFKNGKSLPDSPISKSYTLSQHPNTCPQKTQNNISYECKQKLAHALEDSLPFELFPVTSKLLWLLYVGILCSGIKTFIYKPPKSSLLSF